MTGDKPAKSFFARVLEDLAQRIEGFPLLSNVLNTASGAVDLAVDGMEKLGSSLVTGTQNLGATIAHSFSSYSSLPPPSEAMIIAPQAVPRSEHALAPSLSVADLLPHHAREEVHNVSSALQKAQVGHAAPSLGMDSLNTLSPSPVPNLRQRGGMAQGV